MSPKSKYFLIVFLVIAIIFFNLSSELSAQCAMCRMSAESNLEHGGSSGKGLNAGILYMLAIPYLSVTILGYLLYRRRKIAKTEA